MNNRSLCILRKLLIVVLCLAWPVLATAQQGGRTTYVYDDNGRLVAVVLPTGDAVNYEYDSAGNIVAVTRGVYTKVSIVEFTPDGGTEGTVVNVFGTGFSSDINLNTVTFNGAPAVIGSASPTQLVVTVPAAATTGPITVTTTNGTATSTAPFIVSAAPVITSFTPSIGAPGDPVTITGTDFSPNTADNLLKFNRTAANTTAASTTEISTTVPQGATSGRLSLTTPGGTTQGPDDFFVPPPGYVAANVDDTGRVALGESEILTINNPGNIGLVVFDATAGQSVGVELSNVTLFSGMVALFKPDGTEVDSISIQDSFLDTLPLTQTGTYTIMVTSFEGPGSVTLALNDTTEVSGTIIPDGPPVTVSIITAGRNGRLTFDGTAGQRVFLQASNIQFGSSPEVHIFSPDGSRLRSEIIGQGETFNDVIDTTILPVTGEYSIVIDPGGQDVGEMTLNLYNVPPDLTASLIVDGPVVPIAIAFRGQNALLTFTGAAGERFLVRTSNSTLTESQILLLAPNGTTLEWAGATEKFFETPVLPISGTYTVEVDPIRAATGNISVRLETRAADVTGAITIGGPPVTKTTTLPGQNIAVTFSASAGQKVSILLNNLPNTAFFTFHNLFLYRSDGALISSTGIFNNQTFLVDTIELTESDTYTILVDLIGESVGSATVTLFDTSDVQATLTVDGPPTTANITSPGQSAAFSFEGTVGQWLQITIENQTIPQVPQIRLFKPNGVQTDLFRRLGTRLWLSPLTESGTYKVVVDPSEENIGSITLRLAQDPPATPIQIDGPSVTVAVTAAQIRARLSFQGTAGQRVSVRGTDNTLQFSQLLVFSEDGALLRSDTNLNRGPIFLEGITLPTTGKYYVVVSGAAGSPTGSMKVSVVGAP